MRIKAEIEYDGSMLCGWQRQRNCMSVQEAVESAIGRVLGGLESVAVYGAGRTDAGVHAICQVAHFDISVPELVDRWRDNCSKLVRAVNFYLAGSGVVLLKASEVPSDFHARFSAIMRHYKYVIHNRSAESVLHKNRAWHVWVTLNLKKMQAAAADLLGTHNFESFRSAQCSAANPVRTLSSVDVCRENEFIVIRVSSKSFLHNQVRIIVGTLKQIGEGKLPVECIRRLLEVPDRTMAGETAPPHGLYLAGVDY